VQSSLELHRVVGHPAVALGCLLAGRLHLYIAIYLPYLHSGLSFDISTGQHQPY
jgi:hypothetical protein